MHSVWHWDGAPLSPRVPNDMEETFEVVRSFMENERETMIEEELRLTDAEAGGFWPIYYDEPSIV